MLKFNNKVVATEEKKNMKNLYLCNNLLVLIKKKFFLKGIFFGLLNNFTLNKYNVSIGSKILIYIYIIKYTL